MVEQIHSVILNKKKKKKKNAENSFGEPKRNGTSNAFAMQNLPGCTQVGFSGPDPVKSLGNWHGTVVFVFQKQVNLRFNLQPKMVLWTRKVKLWTSFCPSAAVSRDGSCTCRRCHHRQGREPPPPLTPGLLTKGFVRLSVAETRPYGVMYVSSLSLLWRGWPFLPQKGLNAESAESWSRPSFTMVSGLVNVCFEIWKKKKNLVSSLELSQTKGQRPHLGHSGKEGPLTYFQGGQQTLEGCCFLGTLNANGNEAWIFCPGGLHSRAEQGRTSWHCVSAEIATVKPHVPHMTQFIEHIAGDEDVSDGVVAASCGLIGSVPPPSCPIQCSAYTFITKACFHEKSLLARSQNVSAGVADKRVQKSIRGLIPPHIPALRVSSVLVIRCPTCSDVQKSCSFARSKETGQKRNNGKHVGTGIFCRVEFPIHLLPYKSNFRAESTNILWPHDKHFRHSSFNCYVLHFSDLCTAFGGDMLHLLDKESINQLLTKGRRSKTTKTKTLAQWATREIRKLKNASSWWVCFSCTLLCWQENSSSRWSWWWNVQILESHWTLCWWWVFIGASQDANMPPPPNWRKFSVCFCRLPQSSVRESLTAEALVATTVSG